MVVKYTSLNHEGGFYIYRVHEAKLNKFCESNEEFVKLKDYLNAVFSSCPDDYFNSGPRSSKLKFKTNSKIIHIQGHEVSSLARYGLDENKKRFKTDHSKVQLFMLENDNNTVSIEVPVWINCNELGEFNGLFENSKPLTGHIDVLRIDDGKIWIWDYKPNAHREKYADTQTFFYSLMLSKRTGIPIERFRCGYFDDKHAFIFKPEEIINNKEKIKS